MKQYQRERFYKDLMEFERHCQRRYKHSGVNMIYFIRKKKIYRFLRILVYGFILVLYFRLFFWK